MPYEDEFASDPRAFMARHVLIPMFPASFLPGGSELTAESGERHVRVIELAGSKVLNPPQPGAKVFQFSLDISGLGADAILKIYWVPYRADEFRVGMLTASDRYMFTAAMNGCTLGFGSQAGDGGCIVTHANNKQVGADSGPAAQLAAQRRQTTEFFGSPRDYTVLEPEGYRRDSGGGLNWTACNFGIGDGARWAFWTAKYAQRNDKAACLEFFHGGAPTPAVPIPPPPLPG